jgi:hypothetical protein
MDHIGEEGVIPMLSIYGADVLQFHSPEIATIAQAMVSYPPGIPFSPMDACVEGMVQLRRQDHAFFAVNATGGGSGTGPGALLEDWTACQELNDPIRRLAVMLTKFDAIVLDSGTAPTVFATFSLSEHVPQHLARNSHASSKTSTAYRTAMRRQNAAAMAEALNI